MTRWRQLGALEQGVMSHLWNAEEAQTVRQVHLALCAQRPLAYTTVMTVLRRLSAKDLVVQIRDERAFRYAATRTRGELIAALMFDALDQIDDQGVKHTALAHFVGAVGPDEVRALSRALGPDALASAPETSMVQPTSRVGASVQPYRDSAPDAAVAVRVAPTGLACRQA